MNFNDEINIILKNSGIQLNENDSNEIPEDIDESLKEMIEIINEMESNEAKNDMHALEELSEKLYDCCRNYDRDYESAADRFEQKLFEDAMNDDSTAQYRTREMTDRYYEELCDDFYDSESDNIINLIDKYSNYSLGSIFSDIEDYCNKFFEEEQSEYIDEPQIDPTTIDDQTTIDESFDPEKSENEDMKEIYNYVTTTDPHRAYYRDVYNIFVKCMNCGYSDLESYIQDLEDDLRSGYINDSDNWGTEYDSDATYDYCSSMSMSEKIERYAGYDEINEFKDEVKDLIENEVDYSFSSDDEKEEFYDGSDDELDESVDYTWDYKVGDKVIKKSSGTKWIITRVEPKWISIKRNFKNSESIGDIVNIDTFEEEFKPIDNLSISNKNYDGDEEELDEVYDYLPDNIKGNLEKITNVGDIWKNKYNNKLYTVVEIRDFESVYIDNNNNFHKYYEPLYILRDSDDFNERTCFKEILKRDYYFVGSSDKNYDGSEDELDESISPSWHYEVGDKVVEKDKDVVWVIRYIEKYDIGLRRYAYGGVMTTSCPKDRFEENYELLKQRDSKYVYDGSEEELDESVNKESTPLDKLLKLHKKHPNMSITDIARKITDDNIEDYISLMKQYYEKFEK